MVYHLNCFAFIIKKLSVWRLEVPSKKMVSSIFPADREEVGEGRAAEGRTLQALFL